MTMVDQAYREDYAEKARMDDLRRTIDNFLGDPPSRLRPSTEAALADASEALQDQSRHIMAVWD